MANWRFITYPSMLAYTPSASSENSTYPVTNLNVLDNLQRVYKATGSGSLVNVTLDVGTGNTVSGLAATPGIFLDWANFASIKIQGNSVTTDWTTPPWNQAVTLNAEHWTGRRHGFWKLSELNAAAFAYRYLNIQIQAQSSDDAAAYFLSRVVLGSITEWTVNPSTSIQRRVERPKNSTARLDGSVQITQLGMAYMTVTAPRKLPSVTALNEQLDLDAVSLDPVVLWDAALGGGSEAAWLMQQADPATLSQTFTTFHEGQMTLREVT